MASNKLITCAKCKRQFKVGKEWFSHLNICFNPMKIPEVREHHRRVMQTKEVREKLGSTYWKGKHLSLEHKQKCSKAKKGKYLGENNPRYGKHCTEETKRKIREKLKEYRQSSSFKPKVFVGMKGQDNPMFGKHHTAEAKRKMSEKALLRREQISQNTTKQWLDPEQRTKKVNGIRETWKNTEYRRKHYNTSHSVRYRELRSNISKGLWANGQFREKTIKACLSRSFKRPTSFEQKVIDVIKKHNLPFDYVGNGKVIINYANPDFIQNNGKKLLIEVANRVLKHHPIDYEEKRFARFAQYGFKTLFLRDEDIIREDWESHILSRISGFSGE